MFTTLQLQRDTRCRTSIFRKTVFRRAVANLPKHSFYIACENFQKNRRIKFAYSNQELYVRNKVQSAQLFRRKKFLTRTLARALKDSPWRRSLWTHFPRRNLQNPRIPSFLLTPISNYYHLSVLSLRRRKKPDAEKSISVCTHISAPPAIPRKHEKKKKKETQISRCIVKIQFGRDHNIKSFRYSNVRAITSWVVSIWLKYS